MSEIQLAMMAARMEREMMVRSVARREQLLSDILVDVDDDDLFLTHSNEFWQSRLRGDSLSALGKAVACIRGRLKNSGVHGEAKSKPEIESNQRSCASSQRI